MRHLDHDRKYTSLGHALRNNRAQVQHSCREWAQIGTGLCVESSMSGEVVNPFDIRPCCRRSRAGTDAAETFSLSLHWPGPVFLAFRLPGV